MSRTNLADTQVSPAPPKDTLNIDPLEDVDQLVAEVLRLKKRDKIGHRRLMALEIELQKLREDRDQYQRKYIEAQERIKQLTSPPILVGTIEDVMGPADDGGPLMAIVQVAPGQKYVSVLPLDVDAGAGDRVAVHQRSMTIVNRLPRPETAKISQFAILPTPEVNYADIGGLSGQIQEIREAVEFPISHPEQYAHFNISPPKGVLLCGPPGTGKTLMAKAVAQSCAAHFYAISGPEFVKKYIGEGARIVRELFAAARDQVDADGRPVIIFIDEIDAIAGRRGDDGHTGEYEVHRTLLQLLTELDGFQPLLGISVIAATNRPDILDPALLRQGRIERIITFPIPNEDARGQIFQIHLQAVPTYRVDAPKLVAMTAGMSGADIQGVCREAAMRALRQRMKTGRRKYVIQRDFEEAIAKIRQSAHDLQQNLGLKPRDGKQEHKKREYFT